MSARDDNASPGEPSGKPKRGRPPGKRCNYTTQDAEGRIFKRVLSPFKAKAPASKRSCAADQQGIPIDQNRAAEALPFPLDPASSASILDDLFRSPEGFTGLASTDVAYLNSTKFPEQVDTSSYARQLSAYLGINFKPLHAAESSARQAVFCFPEWDEQACELSFKSFHLPGVWLALFEDGEHLTWWCDCHHTMESARNMFANIDYSQQPAEWLDGRPDKCQHIKALEVQAMEQLAISTAVMSTRPPCNQYC